MIFRCRHCAVAPLMESWVAGVVEASGWRRGTLGVDDAGRIILTQTGRVEDMQDGEITLPEEYGCPFCAHHEATLDALFEVLDPATGQPPNPDQLRIVE